jgi:hypothetical protein
MANKKINQLVAKTTIQSTDLFPIGDATTGTLYKKTIADLQAAIGGAVISVNGLVGTVVLDADDILETGTPTNRYFTEARARASISLTTSGSSGASTYSSSTGVLNVPTYTLAGLGGITATFLSGGTGISYNSTTGVISYSGTVYTDSSVRALFSGGTGITYNSSTGAISYSGTVYTDSSIRALFSAATGLSYNSSTGAFSSTITQYTDALARAAISLTTTGTSGASTYNSTTGVLNIPQYQAVLTNPVTGTGINGYVTFWNGSGTVSGDSALFWDNTNKRLGVGATSPSYRLHVTGTSGVGARTIQADGTGTAFNIVSVVNDGSQMFLATEGVTAGTIATGSLAYAGVVDMNTNTALQFATFATVRMTITNGGNVGIGTTSPNQLLTLSASAYPILGFNIGSTAQGYIGSLNGGGIAINSQIAQPLMFFTNDTERMRITSGGNVGIGTTSPQANLHVLDVLKISNSAQSQGNLILGDGGSTSFNVGIGRWNGSTNSAGAGGLGYFAQGAGNSGGHYFYTGDAGAGSTSERMRITPGGNILMGTTSDNGERLYVSGAIRATGTITANSDITLKKNLTKIENALEKVEQINGYTYEFKEDDSKRHAGVIAQEIQGVLPEIVNKGNDGLLGVEYGNISALLIEAIKEQQKKINELEVKLIALGQ